MVGGRHLLRAVIPKIMYLAPPTDPFHLSIPISLNFARLSPIFTGTSKLLNSMHYLKNIYDTPSLNCNRKYLTT